MDGSDRELRNGRIAAEIGESGWSVCPGFLPAAKVAALRRESLALWEGGAFGQAGVGAGQGRQVRPEIRGDHVLWLEEPYPPAQGRYLEELEGLRLALNRALYLGLFRFEGHLAVYPPGASYARHLDRFERESDRVLSSILYLNDGWSRDDGGELRLYLGPDGGAPTRDVLPEGGSLVLFLSAGVYHEVLPAKRERMSLTGWFRRS